MAINAAMNWYVRAGGSASNGGGFDSTVAGAGTNYADADAAILSLSDLTSTASTTITSVTGGFTAAMIGNVLRLASGTGTTTGYYVVTTFTNSNTITVDRVSGTYTAGVGAVGGAFAKVGASLANGGTATQPAITTPLAAGHTINVRGGGTDNPAVGSPDYVQTGYYQFPAGDTTNGYIRIVGYNGRPEFSGDGLILHNSSFFHLEHLKFTVTSNSNLSGNGMVSLSGCSATDCVFDANGQDGPALGSAGHTSDCAFVNTGSTSAGTSFAVNTSSNGYTVLGCYIANWRGYGVSLGNSGKLQNCTIVNCKGTSIGAVQTVDTTIISIIGCTIDGNAGDGIKLATSTQIANCLIRNNILSNNAGYGVNCSVNTATLNARLQAIISDYNDYFNNGLAPRNNLNAGPNDITLDPQYTNTAGGDYSIGSNLKAKGFPGAFRRSSTTGYTDIGAVQRPEPTTVPTPCVQSNSWAYAE